MFTAYHDCQVLQVPSLLYALDIELEAEWLIAMEHARLNLKLCESYDCCQQQQQHDNSK